MSLLSYVFDLTRKQNHVVGRFVALALLDDEIKLSARIAHNIFWGVSTEVAFSNIQIKMFNTVDKYIITTLKHAIATIQVYTLVMVWREHLSTGIIILPPSYRPASLATNRIEPPTESQSQGTASRSREVFAQESLEMTGNQTRLLAGPK